MKLNYKQRNMLITTILMWILNLIFLGLIADMFNLKLFTELQGFLRAVLYAVAALLLAFIFVLVISAIVPDVKAQNAIMTELETNGYTDRFRLLSEGEINRIVSSGKAYDKYRFFSQYVNLLADYYLSNDNTPAAVDCINHINLKDMQSYLKESLDSNTYLGFFDVQMAISYDLNDISRADAVMQDAGAYLQKFKGKSIMSDLFINEIYCLYYAVHCDFEKSLEYANNCLTHGKIQPYNFVGNGLCAKVYIKAGMPAKANEYINNMESFATTGIHRQTIEHLRKRLKKLQSSDSYTVPPV